MQALSYVYLHKGTGKIESFDSEGQPFAELSGDYSEIADEFVDDSKYNFDATHFIVADMQGVRESIDYDSFLDAEKLGFLTVANNG